MRIEYSTDMAIQYLDFVTERHRIWRLRQQGTPPPWTNHPYLAIRKFTNVFRVLDWDSQWVVRNLMDPHEDDHDTLARLFLFRHTGKIEAWDHFRDVVGRYPLLSDMTDGTLLKIWQEYRGRSDGVELLPNGRTKGITGKPVFTIAYQIYPGSVDDKGSDKLETIINRTTSLFQSSNVFGFFSARGAEERYNILRAHPGVADFMAMQILTDWGYTPHCGYDQEHEFVVCGPGAVRGAKHLSPLANPRDVVDWAQELVKSDPHCPWIPLPGDRKRYPSIMDIQNTLCEFSKLVRYDTATGAIRQTKYRPAHLGVQPKLVLPAHW